MNLAAHIETVARALLGEPNEALSKNGELRFGTNGSMKVNLSAGTFYDFEAEQGGGNSSAGSSSASAAHRRR